MVILFAGRLPFWPEGDAFGLLVELALSVAGAAGSCRDTEVENAGRQLVASASASGRLVLLRSNTLAEKCIATQLRALR